MSYEVAKIKDAVTRHFDVSSSPNDETLLNLIDDILTGAEYRFANILTKDKLRKETFNALRKYDCLSELLEDDGITEIMVNGTQAIFVEKNGRLIKSDVHFESAAVLNDVIQRIAARSNKVINESSPIIDTRLEDGSRVNIVLNPIAADGSVITIRKFYKEPLDMKRLLEFGSLSKELAAFLETLVEAGYNIFISGGTGSGKTTFLNALSNYIPKSERVITIEDSCELKILGVDNLVRLEARNANLEGKNGITIRDMIKASLRMRPDRIIVGEIRGGEALDMLQAMNTGHDGSLSTGHANGPYEMLYRLETMVLMAVDMPVTAIRNQIASAIDIIVHLGRTKEGQRKVLNVCEVVGMKNNEIQLNSIYDYREDTSGDRFADRLQNKAKLEAFYRT